jgi:general secretion pathway protein I
MKAARDKPRRRRGVAAGFTLIEVLVALAIFALAAVVLGAAYVNILTSYDAVSRRSEHEQELRWVRAAVMAEPDREVVEKGGTLPLPDHRALQWTAVVEPASVADLFRVRFRCEIPVPDRTKPWVREEIFFLLRPTWSDPAERDRLRQQSRERLEKRSRP